MTSPPQGPTTEPLASDLDKAELGFSNLEASFANTNVARRPNSIEMKDVWRHNQDGHGRVNELDFQFDLEATEYPLRSLRSLQDAWPAVLFNHYLRDQNNFAPSTEVKCFDSSNSQAGLLDLDENGFQHKLQTVRQTTETGRGSRAATETFVTFFVELKPKKGSSFGSQVQISQQNAAQMFETFDFNPSALLNLVGRPDYWAPQPRWVMNDDGSMRSFDFFCQHPRWNLEYQGAPLSVYTRYDAVSRVTIYLISHKENDSVVSVLQNLMSTAAKCPSTGSIGDNVWKNPLDLAVILSTLSLEASKHHFKKFQRFMWQQVNSVDDHLGGQKASDRARLGELTKSLQIVSQQADSHLLNCDVAIITATAIQDAQARLQALAVVSREQSQRTADTIAYMIQSMEKQKKLFLNFKNRKDGTMNLVYNLVTQQDAATNMQLAASMKKDSTSMNGIAALTMTFLPGTFTASVLSAGIFSAVAQTSKIAVSSLWWVWIVITIPLTLLVLLTWYLYRRRKEHENVKQSEAPASNEKPDSEGKIASRRQSRTRTMSLATLSLFQSRSARSDSENVS